MNVFELTISGMRASGGGELPFFEDALGAAFTAHPAPFDQAWYGELFRAKADDPTWLATSLILNAEKEGEGARRLWQMAAATAAPDAAAQIRRHAVDEARHARIYLRMLDAVFADCADAELRAHLDAIAPTYSLREAPAPSATPDAEERTLDGLIQMNLGEIRTRVNQLLLEPVLLARCPEELRPRLARLLGSIIRDETRHIHYTGALIERAARAGGGGLARDLLDYRMRQFCALTLEEVGRGDFEGS
jgi:rubrerythrin